MLFSSLEDCTAIKHLLITKLSRAGMRQGRPSTYPVSSSEEKTKQKTPRLSNYLVFLILTAMQRVQEGTSLGLH